MKANFKRVPALYQCFSILDLLTKKKKPLSISEISKSLNFNKSTVFNIVYTLTDLGILNHEENKFSFGPKLYVLGRASEKSSELIRNIHPYLVKISQETNLSTFLGLRVGLKALILDKADSTFNLKISTEVGTQIPLLAGAHGKVLLAQLPDEEIRTILSQNELKQFTPYSCLDKEEYFKKIKNVQKEGIAVEREEYIEGIRALAVPLNIKRDNMQVGIWAVGLKIQIKDNIISTYSRILKEMSKKIENEFAF